MSPAPQPSGITQGLTLLIDPHWSPEQALAVVELLDDLRARHLGALRARAASQAPRRPHHRARHQRRRRPPVLTSFQSPSRTTTPGCLRSPRRRLASSNRSPPFSPPNNAARFTRIQTAGNSTFIYPKYRLFVIGFTAVLAVLLWWLLEGTRLGSAVRAGSESTEMVSLLGINVFRVFSLVFALGAATAALAGVLAAPIRGATPFMGVEALSVAFAVVVVGGLGSFVGALVGGLLIGIVQSLMSTIWPPGANLMIYVTMAAVLLLRPHGLLGRRG